jgi:hypothetical protein
MRQTKIPTRGPFRLLRCVRVCVCVCVCVCVYLYVNVGHDGRGKKSPATFSTPRIMERNCLSAQLPERARSCSLRVRLAVCGVLLLLCVVAHAFAASRALSSPSPLDSVALTSTSRAHYRSLKSAVDDRLAFKPEGTQQARCAPKLSAQRCADPVSITHSAMGASHRGSGPADRSAPSASGMPVAPRPISWTQCPAGTALHPALTVVPVASNASRENFVSAVERTPKGRALMAEMSAWGLRPVARSPLGSSEGAEAAALPPTVPWRGPSVEVRSDTAKAMHQPLAKGYRRAERTQEDVLDRRLWARECVRLEDALGWTASRQSVAGQWSDWASPIGSLSISREEIVVHGVMLTLRIRSFLAKLNADLGLPDDSYGPPSPVQGFYSGPWIEDYALATLMRPVYAPVSVRLFQRLNEVAGQLGSPAFEAVTEEGLPVPVAAMGPDDTVTVLLPYDTELFHPWVPLFFPWEAYMTWLSRRPRKTSPPDVTEKLFSGDLNDLAALFVAAMKPIFQYVTVIQRAAGPWLAGGITGRHGATFFTIFTNMLVISSGGRGHVPIPLLAQELPFLECSASTEEYLHLASFVGHTQPGVRDSLLKGIKIINPDIEASKLMLRSPAELQQLMISHDGEGAALAATYLSGRWPAVSSINETRRELWWVRVMASAVVSLAPRGTGPTSFRLYEALQLGLVPVYIASQGSAWLPYLKRGERPNWDDGHPAHEQSIWARIAFVVDTGIVKEANWFAPSSSTGLPAAQLFARTLNPLARTPAEVDITPGRLLDVLESGQPRLERMRVHVARVRDSHFTFDGVVRRIAELIDSPFDAELDCQVPAGAKLTL